VGAALPSFLGQNWPYEHHPIFEVPEKLYSGARNGVAAATPFLGML
jgi:hypothetical protein